jgi:hypothetical protein
VYAATQPAAIKDAAQAIASAVRSTPVLQAMIGSKPVTVVSSADFAKSTPEDQGFNNIVLVGMPDDPVIDQAWLRDARLLPGPTPGMYVFGFGNLLGDIGYIESDRNPFMHAIAIKQAPYETEMITVSGSSPAGVRLAANELINEGLINGVVSSNWHRGETTLLDRDPLKPGAPIGESLPAQLGDWKRIGVTEAGEDEYRGVLADVGTEPQIIWRGKYYRPGEWDAGGADNAMKDFNAGLHRRSYGNTVWVAQFASPAEAASAATKIAAAAHLQKKKDEWTGSLGSYGFEKVNAGPLVLQVKGQWVMMSSVPTN